jgi:retron-type reverse transcriptase
MIEHYNSLVTGMPQYLFTHAPQDVHHSTGKSLPHQIRYTFPQRSSHAHFVKHSGREQSETFFLLPYRHSYIICDHTENDHDHAFVRFIY